MLTGHPQEPRGVTKYGFKIRTRGGMVVDNLLIPGRDQADAEKKLMQIYRYCEILEAKPVQQRLSEDSIDVDGFISLISQKDREPH